MQQSRLFFESLGLPRGVPNGCRKHRVTAQSRFAQYHRGPPRRKRNELTRFKLVGELGMNQELRFVEAYAVCEVVTAELAREYLGAGGPVVRLTQADMFRP